MSIQSMKYHNLPTIKQIEAYNNGRMSLGERKWMDSMIKRNQFVKESVEAAKASDLAAAGRISSYISSNVTSQYLTKVGFWSKYGGWISFSSIAIIIGLGAYFGPDLYNQYNSSENITQVEQVVGQSTENETSIENTVESQVSHSTNKNQTTTASSNNGEANVSDEVSTEMNPPNESIDDGTTVIVDNKTEEKNNPEEKVENKEVKDPAPKEIKLSVLSAKKVTISSKYDPDNKSATNFPTYPGGDLALCDYFKNKLRPIQVPDADKYSKKATVVLQVNSKGKVTSSSISGNIHPTHESALRTAIDNLPRFDSGKSKVQYSVVVSF